MRIVFLWMALQLMLFAEVVHVDYKVKFGILGTIGHIKNTITIEKDRYTIETDLSTTTLIRKLFGNYSAHYVSKGYYKKGRFISTFFSTLTYEKKRKRLVEYTIATKQHKVYKHYRKWQGDKLTIDEKSTLDFYASDDLLTLYFNTGVWLGYPHKDLYIKAVGLEKQRGIVHMHKLSTDKVSRACRAKGEIMGYLVADIVSKNLKKKRNNIVLAIGKEGYVKRATIKDVILYGDLRVIRER